VSSAGFFFFSRNLWIYYNREKKIALQTEQITRGNYFVRRRKKKEIVRTV